MEKLRTWLSVSAVLAGFIIAAFVGHVAASGAVARANEARVASLRSIEALRRAPDELTRTTISYVQTGDSAYKTLYREVAAVREGLRLAPQASEWADKRLAESRVKLRMLADIEQRAFELAAIPDAESRREAIALLNDPVYHRTKAEVLPVIEHVLAIAELRTQAGVQRAEGTALLTLGAIIGLALLLVVALGRAYVLARHLIGSEPRGVVTAVRFSPP